MDYCFPQVRRPNCESRVESSVSFLVTSHLVVQQNIQDKTPTVTCAAHSKERIQSHPGCGDSRCWFKFCSFDRGTGRWLTDVSPLLPLLDGSRCTLTMKTPPWAMPWIVSLNLRFKIGNRTGVKVGKSSCKKVKLKLLLVVKKCLFSDLEYL